MGKTTNKFCPEVRERAVCLVLDNPDQYVSRWQAILSISSKIGCAPQTMNDWVKKVEKIKSLERQNRELKQTNEILPEASANFAPPLGDCMAITCRAKGRSSTTHSDDDLLY